MGHPPKVRYEHFLLVLLGFLTGCEVINQLKLGQTSVAPAVAGRQVSKLEPVIVPEPPKRPSADEVDSQIKLYTKLGRFQEASGLYANNKDLLVSREAEYSVLLKRIIDGLNNQYEKPLNEALLVLKPYEKGSISIDRFVFAKKAINQANEILQEYDAAMSIAEPQLQSRTSKLLVLSIANVSKNVEIAQVIIDAPESQLALLLKGNKIEEAARYYLARKEYFDENTKKVLPVLKEYARISAKQVDPTLVQAQKAILPLGQPILDPRNWLATAKTLNAASETYEKAIATPPFDVLALRSAIFATLEQSLTKTRQAWLTRAPDAFLKYDHTLSNNFFKTYPVEVKPTEIAEQISEQRLKTKSPVEIKAMVAVLGSNAKLGAFNTALNGRDVATSISNEVNKVTAIAEQDKNLAPPPVKLEVQLPPKSSSAVFVDSDI